MMPVLTYKETNQVVLRKVSWDDFPLFMMWRNLPQIYQTMPGLPRPISREEAIQWMGSYVNDENETYGFLRIIQVDGKDVGYGLCRDFAGGIPEYGLAIAEERYWKVGVKQKARELGLEILKERGFKKVKAQTNILPEHIERDFIAFGYEKAFQDANSTWWIRNI